MILRLIRKWILYLYFRTFPGATMRNSTFSSRFGAVVAGLAALVWLSACTDTVYRDRPPFNPPPDAASGFLGYFTAADQQTNCGNCHVKHQAEWELTKHAQAWATLEALPIADKSSCVGCHTVNENGNTATGPAGYLQVADAAYHDVQCENCHGPGFEHVQTPDGGTAPLPSIHVDTTQNPASEADAAQLAAGSCAACHQDTHHPFWEEWRQSLHARMGRHNDEELCLQCHSGQGALEAWGVQSAYKEENAVNEGITCAVCHDPHDATNPGQLRYPLSSTDPSQQLCMKCHNRRSVPNAMDSTRLDPQGQGGSNSPHAPQGPVLLAQAGYQNLNYLDPAVIQPSSHGQLAKNPKLCGGCHLYPFPATNDAGASVSVTGHLFRPIPCYGPDGLPTDSIRTCAYTPAERSFKACAVPGCHGDEATVAGLLSVTRSRIQGLTAALWVNSGTGPGSSSSQIDSLDGGIIPAIYKNTFSQRGSVSNLSLQVKTAAVAGATTIDLNTAGTSTVSGRLAPTNTFRIAGDDTLYTVQNTVTASSNTLAAVEISPALSKAAAAGTKVTVIYLGPLYAGDRLVTPVDGAEWNVRAFGEDANGNFMPGGTGNPSSNTDRSHTVHNPFYAEAMLRANITELTALYGSQPWFPAPSAAVRAIMSSPLGATGSVPFQAPRVSSR
jgi:predicted CXXCH cytochrome family protein